MVTIRDNQSSSSWIRKDGAMESMGLPDAVDSSGDQPNPARVYDAMLGGAYNTARDRGAAEAMEKAWPGAWAAARENRSFLRRAVEAVTRAGCDQFLDLGSGIPTVGNVHEIAQRVNPAARVVYVDNEPVAYQAARQLLAGSATAGMVRADLRDSAGVLRAPQVKALIDFSRPVAVLMVSVLHFIAGDAEPVVAPYREALAPGSYLVISHLAPPVEYMDHARAVYEDYPVPLHHRGPAQVRALFGDLEMLPPGLVHIMDWRRDGPADESLRARMSYLAGVGHS